MQKSKIVDPAELSSNCEQIRRTGGVIVFTNGVYDLLHPGHVHCLEEARRLGTHVIVGLNTDDSTRRIKGDKRPMVPLEARLEVLAAFSSVSFVTWFDEDTPVKIIQTIRPDVLVKGGDWKSDAIVGKEFVESYGGKVVTIPFLPGYSTSEIIKRIVKL
jgi:D-glycero-beta-D-manno-heptose 1-phosphate adenylyltransferase